MTMMIMTSVFTAASILMVVIGVTLLRSDLTVSERLNLYLAGESDDPVSLQELELSKPFSERVLLPIVRQAARLFSWMWPQNRINMLRTRLALAGNPSGITAGDFVGVKGLAMIVVLGT